MGQSGAACNHATEGRSCFFHAAPALYVISNGGWSVGQQAGRKRDNTNGGQTKKETWKVKREKNERF